MLYGEILGNELNLTPLNEWLAVFRTKHDDDVRLIAKFKYTEDINIMLNFVETGIGKTTNLRGMSVSTT